MVVVIALLSYVEANAQECNFKWVKQIGGYYQEQAYSIATDGMGNVFVAGIFSTSTDLDPTADTMEVKAKGTNGQDIFLAKYTPHGVLIWGKSIGTQGLDAIASMVVDKDNNVIIAGYVTGTNGVQEAIDASSPNKLITFNGANDILVAKFNNSGTLQWAKNIGSTGADQARGVATDSEGNVYVTGIVATPFNGALTVDLNPEDTSGVFPFLGRADMMFIKYDSSGRYLFGSVMGGTADDNASSIAIDQKGNFFITGYFSSSKATFSLKGNAADTLSAPSGYNDMFLAKYDDQGNCISLKAIGGHPESIQPNSIAVDRSGNIYLAGLFSGTLNFNPGGASSEIKALGFNDGFVSKYDSLGRFQWVRHITGSSNDQVNSILVDGANEILLLGTFNSPKLTFTSPGTNNDTVATNGVGDIFLCKYNSLGDLIWAKNIGGTGQDEGRAMAIDNNANLFLAGSFVAAVNFDFNNKSSIGLLTPVRLQDAYFMKIALHCNEFLDIEKQACDNFDFSGKVLYKSGIYIDTFRTSLGCDSVVTLHLTIADSSTNAVVTEYYCDSVTLNGTIFLESGTYLEHFTNAVGCDSNIVHEVIIRHTYQDTLVVSACGSFQFDTVNYDQSGYFTHVFTGAESCDSVQVLDLTINAIPNAKIALDIRTLVSVNAAEKFQWLRCDRDFEPIPGATEQSFTPPLNETAQYAVVLQTNGCADTSECLLWEYVGINAPELVNINMYPNPTIGLLHLQTDKQLNDVVIRIANLTGQLLTEVAVGDGRQFRADLSSFPQGMYVIELKAQSNTYRFRAVKH